MRVMVDRLQIVPGSLPDTSANRVAFPAAGSTYAIHWRRKWRRRGFLLPLLLLATLLCAQAKPGEQQALRQNCVSNVLCMQ